MECHTGDVFHVPVALAASPIRLWHHLAIKLVLNTISTATMARMGRVLGNWMVHVETTNKKLIDRGTRLIAELAGLSYEEACLRLHETMEEVEPRQRLTRDAPSPVALALARAGAMEHSDDPRQ
jgi:N-acetylmuramic acid 6-phosphate etherase